MNAIVKSVGPSNSVLVRMAERFGVDPDDAVELAERLRAEGLLVDGVMAIGPQGADRGETERAFTRAASVMSIISLVPRKASRNALTMFLCFLLLAKNP